MLTLQLSQLPDTFKELSQPPKHLYASNSQLESLLKRPRIAVVGSRHASPYGKNVTTQLVRELVRQGVVIVSGLALGIDSIAHTTCVEEGGATIAVLPCGLDRIYPSSHTRLGHQIQQHNGVLVSEYPLYTEPMKYNFIARNRIIAALSNAVLLTEAAVKSGSLHTVNFALELGLSVLAVPGNITSKTSEGCNNLIRSGASLVTNIQDIFDALGWGNARNNATTEINPANEQERVILELLRSGVCDGSILLNKSGLNVAAFGLTLSMLEITGKIKSTGNNTWSL
jgi:DNA processing protein